jgi:hypothetical protein
VDIVESTSTAKATCKMEMRVENRLVSIEPRFDQLFGNNGPITMLSCVLEIRYLLCCD